MTKNNYNLNKKRKRLAKKLCDKFTDNGERDIIHALSRINKWHAMMVVAHIMNNMSKNIRSKFIKALEKEVK